MDHSVTSRSGESTMGRRPREPGGIYESRTSEKRVAEGLETDADLA